MKLVKSRTGGATLELRVAGPVAALIQHQAPLILDRLNLYLGDGRGGAAAHRAGAAAAGRRRRPLRRSAAPGRRSTPPPSASSPTSLADAPDGPLKDALLRLGREVLRGRPR